MTSAHSWVHWTLPEIQQRDDPAAHRRRARDAAALMPRSHTLMPAVTQSQATAVGHPPPVCSDPTLAATPRATFRASAPTPNSREDRRVRRKWTPQKYRPGTIVLAPSTHSGNP